MEANIEPHVLITVDVRETVLADIEAAVLVDTLEVGCFWDGIVLAGWESPVAPLLGVVDLKDVGDQRWAGSGRDLVEAVFCARLVKVRASRAIVCGCPEGLVLGAEAVGAVD